MSAGLSSKDKEALAYLYELNEYKAFPKLCTYLREKAVKLIVNQNMAEVGSDKIIAMLQGEIEALDKITLQWRKIHKENIDKAIKER